MNSRMLYVDFYTDWKAKEKKRKDPGL